MRHCFRFISGYRLNLTGPLLEFAVKKFKSHRAIPSEMKQAILEDFEVKHSGSKTRNRKDSVRKDSGAVGLEQCTEGLA